MRGFICVTCLLLMALNVHAQGIKVAVLSPTANQEFYLGEKMFFDYAPLDDNIEQLNIFMESFGKTNSEEAIKLVADISKAPNGTYTTNGHTYNKFSLYYTIPSSLPTEDEAYQVSFETSEGDIVIPIKMKAPMPAMTTSNQDTAHVTEIILHTTANNATVTHTASTLNVITNSALLNSVTATQSSASSGASSLQTPVTSASNISTSSSPGPSSSSSSSFSPTLLPSSTSSASKTGLFSASLIASTTPIPPDPESFMQSSAARNYSQNSEFSFIAATLLALLLVRLLLV